MSESEEKSESVEILEKQFCEVLEKLQRALTNQVMNLNEQKLKLQTAANELEDREKTVIRMERSIREHMQHRSDLEERLSSASSKENTAYLKLQLVETEKENLRKTLTDTEERLKTFQDRVTDLEEQTAELQLTNQKLTAEKMKLLKMQINGGNEHEK